jgi:hypothetical protein
VAAASNGKSSSNGRPSRAVARRSSKAVAVAAPRVEVRKTY